MAEMHTPTGPTTSLSFEQLQQLISLAIREAKEPPAEEKAKREADKARLEAKRAEDRKSIELERQTQLCKRGDCKCAEEGKRCVAARCTHTKQDGRSTIFRGQVFSDGYFHPICVRCQKTLPAQQPNRGELTGGM